VMPLPAYVNFYNVQDADGTTLSQSAEGSLEFADNMWGTFLDVDYRKSGPKLICFYAGIPSAQLDLPKGNSRFRDDAFELRRASENPLIENQVGKKDWALSNKCVGFNVDIGTRNQNIFYSFSVSMDSGKATSESVQTQLNMVDQASGRNVATQNVGLYNLYKQRSYQCQVVCLGNALLQPTMYFNLRHVPMFNGPYLITEVNHTITAGEFQTNFSGIRQGIYDLPSIDNLLQSINLNLLTQIESVVKNKKDSVSNKPITNINKSALLSQTGNNAAAATNTCTNSLNTNYSTWGDFVESATISLTPQEMATAIKNKTSNPDLQLLIYLMCYITTFNKNKFYGYNNNFVNAALDTYWGASTQYFIQKQSSCVSLSGSTNDSSVVKPIANFKNIDDFLSFMVARLTPNITRIRYGENGSSPIGIDKYYVCYWTPPTATNENITSQYFDEHLTEFKKLFDTLTKGVASAKEVGFTDVATNGASQTSMAVQLAMAQSQNNLNTTTLPGPVCLPPSITSFSPLTGVTGTILNITGNDLSTVTAATINGVTTTTGITINSGVNIVVLVPFSNTTVIQNNTITLKGTHGNGTSSTIFTYNPSQTSAAPPTVVPGVVPNANTQPQQTGPVTMVSQLQNGLYSLNQAYVDVNITPSLIGTYSMLPSNIKPVLAYKVTKNIAGPNNTITKTVLKESSITLNDSYFQSPTHFYIDQTQIIDKITSNWQSPPSGSEIVVIITINAHSVSFVTPYVTVPQSFKVTIQL